MHKFASVVSNSLLADARLLNSMASVYPGDITGNISREAFVLEYIAELIDDVDWDQVAQDYEADRPVVEVTVDNV